MSYQHRIPLHLEQEDKFIFNCTARQTLIIGIGLAFGSILSSYFDFSTLYGCILGSLVFACVIGLSLLTAFLRYRHRYAEQHALIALMYLSSPHCYIRGRFTEEINEKTAVMSLEEEESEAW